MDKKEQKISPIKQRILYFADTLHISKREFYAKIGVSRGTLESNTGITENVLTKIIAIFPEIDLYWLILGEGDMLKDDAGQTIVGDNNIQVGNNNSISGNNQLAKLEAQITTLKTQLQEKDALISTLHSQISAKDAQIDKLLSIIENHKK